MLDIEIGMAAELREAPDAVRRQDAAAKPIAELVARCRRIAPRVVVTCARGSSAHAATFGKHLIERHLGIPVAAAAPNIATVYDQRLKLKDQLVLIISQSGHSDDLVEFAAMAEGIGRADRDDRERHRQPARRGLRHCLADGGGARVERRGDEIVRRVACDALARDGRMGE